MSGLPVLTPDCCDWRLVIHGMMGTECLVAETLEFKILHVIPRKYVRCVRTFYLFCNNVILIFISEGPII